VPYEYFEHTADVGIRAWGATLDEAFAQAALGLVASIVDVGGTRAVGEADLLVEGDSPERLLHRFLEEVLDLTQTRLWVLHDVEVRLEGGTLLRSTLRGEAYDSARHGHVHEVKAITLHGLSVRRGPPAEVRVIVDI
jgi:SHS2 domain-containing protein